MSHLFNPIDSKIYSKKPKPNSLGTKMAGQRLAPTRTNRRRSGKKRNNEKSARDKYFAVRGRGSRHVADIRKPPDTCVAFIKESRKNSIAGARLFLKWCEDKTARSLVRHVRKRKPPAAEGQEVEGRPREYRKKEDREGHRLFTQAAG